MGFIRALSITLLRVIFSALLSVFSPVIFAYYAVAVFYMAILNYCTDHPEQGEKPNCSDSHFVSSMQNRGAGGA